jgi:uncharacterized membrane protein YeiH
VAAATPTPTASPAHTQAVVATPGNNSGSRPLLVAVLSAVLAAVIGGYVTALLMGRLPNPFQRRVWGRRTR